MKRLLALAALLPLALHAAVPQFTENIACGPVRLRLPKGVEATPMPALESYRFIRQMPDGSATEFDAFAPEQLWRRDQRLGAWADKEGNRYELVAPKSRLGGPYSQTVVTQEEYDRVQAQTGVLKPSALGMWLGEWAQATCGKPQPLRPLGAVRAAQFATVGNAAGWEWTALAVTVITAVGTLVMALYANVPYALAPGLGMASFLTVTVCGDMGFTWQEGLSIVFICGLVNIAITLTNVRRLIIAAIPRSLQLAISGGIGLFLAYVGLLESGLLDDRPDPALDSPTAGPGARPPAERRQSLEMDYGD